MTTAQIQTEVQLEDLGDALDAFAKSVVAGEIRMWLPSCEQNVDDMADAIVRRLSRDGIIFACTRRAEAMSP